MNFNLYPFPLGMQYENWEFDLTQIGETIYKEISLEIYEYTGFEKLLLEFTANKIKLMFNADVLMKVVYTFEGNCEEKISYFVAVLKDKCLHENNVLHFIQYSAKRNETTFSYEMSHTGE